MRIRHHIPPLFSLSIRGENIWKIDAAPVARVRLADSLAERERERGRTFSSRRLLILREKRDAMHYSEVRSAPLRLLYRYTTSALSRLRARRLMLLLLRLKIDNRATESCNRVNFHPIINAVQRLYILYKLRYIYFRVCDVDALKREKRQ